MLGARVRVLMGDKTDSLGTVRFTELDALAIRVERLEQRLAMLEAVNADVHHDSAHWTIGSGWTACEHCHQGIGHAKGCPMFAGVDRLA